MENEHLKQHKFIVLDGGHFNPLGIVRSLGEKGILSDVIAIDSPNAIMTKSKYVKIVVHVQNAEEGIDYILSNYLNKPYKPFILTGSDSVVSIIDKYYNQLKDSFYIFNCGCINGINRLLSKFEQNVLAREAGFNVPDFEEVNVGDLPKNVKYPILTKASSSTIPGWKSLTHICKNEAELLAAYKTMDCKRILLQEYIEKENETGFDALAIKHGEECYLPLQLSYHYTTETSFGSSIYFFEPTNLELLNSIKKIMKNTGFEGIFSIDFLKGKNGKLYFLEINFRNSAWSYPSTCAGVNLPYIWALSTLSGKLETDDVKIKKTPFSAIDEITELALNRTKGFKIFFNTVKKVIKSNSYITWNTKDFGPFIYSLKRFIKTHVK